MSETKPKSSAGNDAVYQSLIESNTTHAVSLSNRIDDSGCIAYEHKHVEVSLGIDTTKVGLSI